MIKSWAINVKKSIKKRIFFEQQAKRVNLDFKFYDAVTPKTLHNHEINSNEILQRKLFARPLLKTEIACAISHRNLWQMLIDDKNADYYCIFEDDTFINKDLVKILNHDKLNNLDLIKFSGIKIPPHLSLFNIYKKYKLVNFAYGPLDAAAYRISKKGAQKLLSFTYDLTYPIDVMMDRSYDHGIKINAVLPYPCKTEWHFNPKDPLYTDIGPREFKYEKSRSFLSKLSTRINRVQTSFKKRISYLKLYFNHKINSL